MMLSWLLFGIALLAFLVALAALVFCVQQVWFPIGYVPTAGNVGEEMLEMADLKPGMTVMDLGAGDGRLLIAAVRKEPGVRAVGYEGALMPWLASRILIRRAGVRAEARLGNLLKAPLGEADVILLYLWPSLLARVSERLKTGAKKGCVVVSHAFPLPGFEPFEVRTVTANGRARTLRAYRVG